MALFAVKYRGAVAIVDAVDELDAKLAVMACHRVEGAELEVVELDSLSGTNSVVWVTPEP